MKSCCELFKIESDHGSFDREKRKGKVYWWVYLYDDKNREGCMIPNISPIHYCPHCGNKLQ